MALKRIPLSKLEPHPHNPRFFLRESTVAAIAAQIAERGSFDESHALRVRPLTNGNHQIISGHQRFEAAKRAKVKDVPCFVVEMNDEEAFREVLLSNAQSDLAPLEIGMHVLVAVGKSKGGRGKQGGVRDYARNMGKEERTLADWVAAAEVAKLCDQSRTLLDYTSNLSIIHRAPEEDWPELVRRMLAGGWTKEQTERVVEVVKTLEVPDDLKAIFPRAVLLARFFEKHEFSQNTLLAVVQAIQGTESIIRAHGHVKPKEEIAAFRAYLAEHAQEMLDARAVMKWQRTWQAEQERREAEQQQSEQWYEGDWRTHIDSLQEGSVALVLTDPPYGMDYQSGRRVASTGFNRIENDGLDQTVTEVRLCFQALFPKLKTDAHVLCFCHWRYEPEIRAVLAGLGYAIRGSLVWVKDQYGPGDLTGSFAPKHERILHVVKGSPILYQRDADVLEYPRITKSAHPNEKPVALLQQLMEATTVEGDLVVDPFAGIASTLVAAKQLSRIFWGCELEAEFFQAGAARLKDAMEAAA